MAKRTVSLSTRASLEEVVSQDAPITLITIRHPLLDAPLRLSTAPTVRVSTEPLRYAVLSRMLAPDITSTDVFNLETAAQFDFVLMEATLPEDREEGFPTTEITFENVESSMVGEARKLKTPATIDFAVVLADSADYVDFAWTGLYSVGADWDESTITIGVSRENYMGLSYPFGRMTRNYFPGLY